MVTLATVSGGVGSFPAFLQGDGAGGGIVLTVDRDTCTGIGVYVLDLQQDSNLAGGTWVSGYGQATERLVEDDGPVSGYVFHAPDPDTGVGMVYAQQEIGWDTAQSADRLRVKFRVSDDIDRDWRYYHLQNRWHYYSYWIEDNIPPPAWNCEHYFLSQNDIAAGWTYTTSQLETEWAMFYGFQGDDYWEVEMLGNGSARLKGIGLSDQDQGDFTISANTWYIFDYYADGATAHLDLHLASGDNLGALVVALSWDRGTSTPMAFSYMNIGAYAQTFDTGWHPSFDWVKIRPCI